MPRHWRRPLTQTYSTNYRYGESLYSGLVDEIGRKNNCSLRGGMEMGGVPERPTIRSANQLLRDLDSDANAIIAADMRVDEVIMDKLRLIQARRRTILRNAGI